MMNIGICVGVAAILWLLEQVVPSVKLKEVPRWYLRAFIFNGGQAVIALLAAYLWDVWFLNVSLASFKHWPIVYQVLLGYFFITFIYYWWHRARHSVPFFWRYLHQFHHSPVRIEVITSFYKNPIEILINGILTSAILYILLGLSVTAVGLCVLVTALAEFVYHMNITTPQIMGFFFQRPEMHRVHHQRGLHHYNYSDLPLWDMMFGTYSNPKVMNEETGFPNDSENSIVDLLRGKNIKL